MISFVLNWWIINEFRNSQGPYLRHNWVEFTGVKLPIISRNGAAKFVICVSRFKGSRQITCWTVVFTSPWRFNAEKCWNHNLKSVTEDFHKPTDQQKSVLISVHTADLLHHIINCESHDFAWWNTYSETNKKSLMWTTATFCNMFSTWRVKGTQPRCSLEPKGQYGYLMGWAWLKFLNPTKCWRWGEGVGGGGGNLRLTGIPPGRRSNTLS